MVTTTIGGPSPTPTRAPDDPVRIARGGTLRFFGAAGDGRRSSSGRIWTSKNHKDVYLAPRALAGQVKISQRESGKYQSGFINAEVSAAWQGLGADRHLDRWPRPPQFEPGWTKLFEVVLPVAEMRRGGEDLGKNHYEVLPVGPGYSIHIFLLHAKVETPNFPALSFANTNWMSVMELGDSEYVSVMAVPQEWAGDAVTVVEQGRHRAIRGEGRLLRPPDRTRLLLPSTRFFQHGAHVDGSRFVIDAAATPLGA